MLELGGEWRTDTGARAWGRRNNVADEIHAHWRLVQPLVVVVEYRRMTTTYLRGPFTNDHLQLSFGFEF
ncbi:MAG: hypothetical protein P3C10_08915 [Gemmatimonadota bacterium]|nr:hypothetical protein [Gemmatimonadota bacterium]